MADGCTVTLNGEPAARGEPGSYVKLEREWRDGDALAFEMPMAFRAVKYTGKDSLCADEPRHLLPDAARGLDDMVRRAV